jgi:hypothetical protein
LGQDRTIHPPPITNKDARERFMIIDALADRANRRSCAAKTTTRADCV